MTDLKDALDQYLTLRRSLGYKLQNQERRLRNFVEYARSRGERYITSKLAVEWAGHQCGAPTWSSRLSTLRSFARHVAVVEPRTEIPPSGIFPPQRRRRPHIYSDEQISDLLATMPALHPNSLRGRTYQCFFGLLASTGVRFSEAAGLQRDDADLTAGVLTIRQTKFGKSRIVPLHHSTTQALARYAAERDVCLARRAGDFFFTGENGCRLNHANPHYSFIVWTYQAGLRKPGVSRGPRIHDLRHTFAVRTLLSWYERGEDIERRLPELSTFLGHTHIRDTYWYLSAHPKLLDQAKLRLEASWEAPE
ncbi:MULTISPECIES: tyrosine-type recombinase/integrase [Rhizobiaceae]|uniref:tyrosine-type recombinase/integrase n=1 Tax=Rhizobiaceae TaxID=82115 RepID=UPI0003C53D52|nr:MULTISPECIES: tyrosine-type recombinase/integrase [Hyphomicrobiales]EYR84392.1 putative integrase/recombinase y4rB [Shinella sp. DD12]MCA0342533.1 tyrosine-type recombinase/integrase [Pseudomonadota bacterium]VVS97220.1 putative integrase/recombinase y4rB [Hoeflea sp. EC-HK425]